MSRRTAPDAHTPSPGQTPLAVLRLLTVVFVLVFTPLTVFAWRQAWADWHAVRSDGTVVGIRLMKVDRPAPRAAGPWRVVWEVERDPGGPGRASVIAAGSYTSEARAEEASRGDPGRRVTVWQAPWDDGPGSLDPPDLPRGLFAAVWTTAMAAVGWLGVAAFVQLAWRRLRRRSARPDQTPHLTGPQSSPRR